MPKCTGKSKAVFKVFIGYSLRSAIEVVSCLFIIKKRGHISADDFGKLYTDYESLVKMITVLRNSLKYGSYQKPYTVILSEATTMNHELSTMN
ncbi:four helix bundle protein [Mucilaginibacter sp. RB4R14]|nr:four helix bundle protein [Mucilaginibacter aurantiaciroseus]MCO5935440.1 four helix bundle protein [Mucilaginibacter aurantiaciroseus]